MRYQKLLPAIVAATFAALFVSSPTPAKADDAATQAVAEWLFTDTSLHNGSVTIDGYRITVNNENAKFNNDGRVLNLNNAETVSVAIVSPAPLTLAAPDKPLQITGSGSLTLRLAYLTISGNTLLSLNSENAKLLIHGTESEATIDALTAEAGSLTLANTQVNKLDISGSGKVTGGMSQMTDKTNLGELKATNTNPESSFVVNSGTVNNLYTAQTFKGTLKIGNMTDIVKQNTFSGGNIEINNALITFEQPIKLNYTNDSAFPTLTVNGATVKSSGSYAAMVTRGSLLLNDGATINGNVIVSDPMNNPYGNTLELDGGKIHGDLTITNADLKFKTATEGEPAISGAILTGDNTNIYVIADGGKITESSISIGTGVNAYIQSPTEQVFTVDRYGDIELSGEGNATIDSVSENATVVAGGEDVSIGAILGGTVTINGSYASFTSNGGNTAGTINLNRSVSISDSIYLDGTNLNINGYTALSGGLNKQVVINAGEVTVASGASLMNGGLSFFPTVELPDGSSGKLSINGGTVSTVHAKNAAVKMASGEIVVQDGGYLVGLEQSGGKTTVGNNNHASKISAATVSGGELNIGLMGQVEMLNSVSGGNVNLLGGDIAAMPSVADGFSDGAINISAETLFNFPLNFRGTDLNVDQYTLHMMANRISVAGDSAITVTNGGAIEFMGLESSTTPAIEVTGGSASLTLGSEDGGAGNIKLVDSEAPALGVTASTANLWAGSINGTPAITQSMGEMNIGKAATEESEATGPEIDGSVSIEMGEANILGGKINGDLIVADTQRTDVTVGTAAHDGIKANGPTVTGSVPEPMEHRIVINYVNKEPEPTPEPEPEPEPEPQPEPPAPAIPSPDKVLSQVAPKIKETMADYASAEYSSDYRNWQFSIENAETSVSTLAKDFVSELLQSLSTSTVKSAKSGDVSVSLPATAAKREAFANEILGNADGDKTLESLFGKTIQIDFTASSGKVLTLTIVFSDAPSPEPEVVTIYRLYNPYLNGAHMLTLDANEFVTLKSLGWQDEGARFSEFKEAGVDTVPVFRLYNPNNGDHFFTESENEVQTLESVGWTREGIAWYAPVESELPAYRLYNPYQTEYAGLSNHLWTVDEHEKDVLGTLGWQYEGIGWYAMPLVAD